jgi:D-galactose 1-dehydrogenase
MHSGWARGNPEMHEPVSLAIIGMGKIARDQHLPAIAGEAAFRLAGTASRSAAGVQGAPHAATLDALLQIAPDIRAVSLCTPPQVRYALAAAALGRGLHVFLEKPPGATLSEVDALQRLAARSGSVLFASWHSRFAPGVGPARAWLANRRLERVTISWREDVRHWHPGQAWIWEAGGFGVFDPGINALSILTEILPRPVLVQSAVLEFPANRMAPIAARLELADSDGVPIAADFDWRQTGPQTWDIRVETDAGACILSQGGAVLDLPDRQVRQSEREYPELYARFAQLIREGRSEVDVAPLRLVADSFLRAERKLVEPFDE